MDMNEDTKLELYRTRKRLKVEMQKALSCISAASKRKIAQRWKTEYSELFYRELIACAKNKEGMREIANWDLDNFKGKR